MSVREVKAALALDGCVLLRRNAHLEVEEVFRVVLPLYCNHQLKIARIVVSEERLTSLRRLRIWNKVLVGEIDERALGVRFHLFAKVSDPSKATLSQSSVIPVRPPRLILEHEGLVAECKTALLVPDWVALDRTAHGMKAEVSTSVGLRQCRHKIVNDGLRRRI